MPLQSGDKLGPYEILVPIGAGGMGEVYRARDTRPRKLEAIGPAVPVAAQELEEGPNSIYAFSASGNGSIVFQSASDSPGRMIWFGTSGKELSQIPQAG